MKPTPTRQIRARYDEGSITVYQAYSQAIAVPAAAQNSFVGTPFKRERMTWIKPSFLWMMYRCGWATKPDQEHVLAIRITRAGFEEAIEAASLSHFDPQVYADHTAWKERKAASPVRVQWDPERDISLEPLPWRSLQMGLSGPVVDRFIQDWIVDIEDITGRVRQIQELVQSGDLDSAAAALPEERPYPLPPSVAAVIGAAMDQTEQRAASLLHHDGR